MRRKFLLKVMILSLLFAMGGGNLFAQTTVNDETSLKNALAIGGEVILGADIALVEAVEIPENVNVTLDLNGNTIKNGSGNSEYVIYNQNGGTLTIKDSGTDGKISGVVYTGSASETFIKSGTFNAITNYALLNSGGTLTINGGTINGNTSYPVYSYDEGHKLVINDGVVVNGKAGCVNAYGNNGTVEINGGEFNFEGVEGKTYHIVYVSINTSMTINGGTFLKIGDVDLNGEGGGGVCVNGGAALTVTGGTFDGAIKDIDNYATTTTIEVSGGTFSDMSAKDYITEGSTVTMAGKTYTKTEDGLLEINKIATKEDLIAFAEAVNGGNNYQGKLVALATDITLTDEWTPIGNGSRSSNSYTGNAFKGVFDGGGKTISGLSIISGSENDTKGLFGVVDGGTVKNLKLTNVNISTSSKNVGAAAGLMVNNATIDEVEVSGTLEAPDGVGGIVGRMIISGTISNCTNYAVVSATTAAGGIVGKAYYSALNKTMNITDCVNEGAITGDYAAGGIAGLSAANISNCSNTAVIASNEAGGIVGEQIMYGTINDNENSGLIKNINNGGTAHGGIIGWLRYHESTTNYPLNGIINVTNNTNTANIEATGATGGSGGIVGHIYNQANVTGNTNKAEHIYGGAFAAGIAGSLQQAAGNLDIENTTITVSGNVSLTSIENISVSGSCEDCKDLFAYNNAPGTFVVKDNLSNSPIASVDGVYYTSLEEAFAAAIEGQTITLLADATPTLTSQRAITKASVIDLGGKTLTLTEDDLYFGTTTFQNGNIVVDPSVKASTAVFWMFANQTLTLDNVKLTATGVTGTYLIGINGGTGSNVSLLNGTSILIDNESQAALTAVICDNGTGNNVTIENSVININKVEGRFYLGGTNGTITVDNTNIDLNGVKEGFYLRAGQALSIEGTSEVEITLNDTNGRYGINVTDLTATYTIAETATVEATVYEPAAAAKIGTTKYATFQAAVNAAANDDVITLLAEINENVTITQKADVKFTIDGAQKTMTGAITVDGKSATIMTAGVTIKNINFDASNITTEASINLGVKGNTNTRYICNLTVENCKFSDTDYSAVAIKSYTGGDKNLVVKGCEATGMHSLAQLANVDGLTVSECTVDCARGIALGSSNNVIIDNCDIKAFSDKYGVRADANVTINITIKDSKINAFIPVVVREVNAASNIAFQGTNTMTATNTDGLWCAIGTSEYETNGVMPTAPTGQVTVTLNDTGLNPSGIYGNYAPIKLQDVNNNVIAFHTNFEDALAAAIADENVARIEVSENVTQTTVKSDEYYDVVRPLSIGTAGTEVSVLFSGCDIDVRVMGEDAKLIIEQDLTIEGLGIVANGFETSDESMVINGTLKALSLKQWTSNETITVSETGSVWLGYGDGQFDMAYGNGTVTINGNGNETEPQFKAGYSGTRGNGNTLNLNNTYFEGGAWFNVNGSNGIFNIDNSVLKVSGGDNAGSLTVTSSGNTFNLTDGAKLDVATLILGAGNNITIDGTSQLYVTLLSGEGTINIDATNLTETSMPIVGNASDFAGEIKVINNDDLKVIIDENGNVHIVEKVYVAQIGETKYESLQDALNAGGEITVLRNVNLTEGLTVADDKTVTLDLNGKTITGTPTEQAEYVLIANLGELTITDNTETKEGKILCNHTIGGSGNYAVNTISNRNGGVLTIVAGIIENTSTSGNPIGYAIDNYPGSAVIIKGGKITASGSNYYDGIRQFCNSETLENSVTIEGGEVSSLWLQNPSDGTVDRNTKDVKGSFAISGGTLHNLYLEPSTQFAGSITGGYVGSVSAFETAEGRDLTGFITGGTFGKDVTEFLAEGFKLEEIGEGTYGVVPFVEKAYEISANGEIKTFADAITKAKEDGADIVTYTIYGAATLETGGSHGIVDFGGKAGYITIQGGSSNMRNAETDSFTITGGGVPDIKGVAFKDLTFYDEGTYLTTANEFMYQNFIDCTFENVTFEDGIRLSGNNVVENCTFNANTYNEYAIWLDEGEFTMTGSNVTAGDDAYGMIKSDEVDKITITGNTFQYLGKVNKEALNVKDATIVAEDNTFIDCAKGVVPTDKTNYTEDGENITDAIIAENNTIIIYVAKINDVKYQSLAAAATAAQNGETIELLWAEGHAPILMTSTFAGKTVTITGTAEVVWEDNDPNTDNWFYVGRNGADDGKVIFNKADLTSKSNSQSFGFNVSQRKKETEDTHNGTIEIIESNIEVDYMLNRNIVTLDNSTLTVKNFIGVAGRIASETETNDDGTATLTLTKGSKIITYNMNGAGIGFDGIGIMNIDETSSLEGNKPFIVAAKGTLNNAGTVNITGVLTNDGTINFTSDDATLATTTKGLTINYNLDQDKKVVYQDGVYKVVDKAYVAQIDNGNKYESLQEAIEAVEEEGTVTLLRDEIFTVNNRTHNSVDYYDGIYYVGGKSFTIDLNNKTIKQDGSVNDYLLNFKNDGEKANVITLKNGTIDAGTAAYCALATASSNNNKITINTEKINFVGKNSNGSVLKIRGGAELNVNAGTVITGNDSYLGIENSASTVNIYEGTEIYMYGTTSYNGCLVGVGGNGTINVYGGKGTGAKGAFIAMTSGGIINVYDGEWIANTDGTISNDNKGVLIAQNDKATYTDAGQSIVNVTGGIFRGGYNCYGNADGDAQINISGGNFNADPTVYVIENYDVKQLANGYYTVIQTSGTQTRELTEGWHWFSTYVDLNANGQNSVDVFKAAFVDDNNEVSVRQIKNQVDALSYNSAWGIWSNTGLLSIANTDMYMINMKNSHTLELTGDFAAQDLEITLNEGWTWIGYPINEEINLVDALANLEPLSGDMIKSQTKSATYTGSKWKVENGFERMMPGEGYKYYRESGNTSFTYSTDVKPSGKSDVNVENNNWIVDASKYPDNMTIIAMLSIDGEIVKDNYEIAAFANGECRGSARPVYVEEMDAYILILTVQGDEVENLTFKYYDVNYSTEYELNNTMVYSTDAIVGSIEEPYMFNLGILNIEESSVDQINIYPNPTTTGNEINLQAMCDKVEVFNALGVKVAEYTNVDSIDALETAGIYVIRVTIDGNARNCRLIVK